MQSSRANDSDAERTDAPAGEERPEQAAGDGAGTGDDGALKAELARAEDRYKRALADLDNYRKRAAREVERHRVEIRDELARDWLEVVDSVERALRMETDSPAHEGLRAILDQIDAVLARHGVRRIGEVGERFDPERHEAVSVQDTDEVADHTVLQVTRSGFAIGDYVLRPAQVVVSRRPQAEA
jgi:molecular chaperone GrpE